MSHAWLDISGQRHLVRGLHFGIGRGSDRSVVLTDPSVSRDHAQLVFGEGAWWLWDNESRNGTFCDGVRVGSPVRLKGGELLRFGSVEARFVLAAPNPDETQRSGSGAS